MKVLLLAPQPFYSERGTPISEENLVRVMSSRGWDIDLLTYAEGEDVELPGLTIHRIPAIPGIRHVPPGFSGRKVVSDAVLAVEAVRQARKGGYDLVHGLEEAVFIAVAIHKLFGIPYVYDMDSILSEQLIDRFPVLRHVGSGLRYCEEVAVSGSLGVVAVCESLAGFARAFSPVPLVARLEDRTQLGPARTAAESLRSITGPDRTIALYVGNLERYQGIDLLLEGFVLAALCSPDLALVVIGGSEEDIEKYRNRVDDLSPGCPVHFLGPRPVEHLRDYLEQADILVSPRICGTNTPMKIYSFLDAGVPVAATRLDTHLQVLDDEIACLFEPTRAALASALVDLAADPDRRRSLARRAALRVSRLYSLSAYEAKANQFLEAVEVRLAPTARAGVGAGPPVDQRYFRRREDSHLRDTTLPSGEVPRPARPEERSPAPSSPG